MYVVIIILSKDYDFILFFEHSTILIKKKKLYVHNDYL